MYAARMNAARWLAAPIAAAILALGTPVGPALAGPPGPVGDRISLHDGDQTYPAGTAFHIEHGITWFLGEEPASLGVATVTLDVDGSPQALSYSGIATYGGAPFLTKWFGFNFPDGMTGTHTFTGRWWIGCGTGEVALPCGDDPPNTPVELLTREITVTFTTD